MHETAVQLLLLAVLLVASVTDLRWQRVPNWLTFPTIIGGIVAYSVVDGGAGALFSSAGMLAGFAFLIPFYALGGMGAGDVKLLSGVGAWIGAKAVVTVFLATALIGGVYAIVLWLAPAVAQLGLRGTYRGVVVGAKTAVLTGQVRAALPSSESAPKLCYAVCIATATLLTQTGPGKSALAALGIGA